MHIGIIELYEKRNRSGYTHNPSVLLILVKKSFSHTSLIMLQGAGLVVLEKSSILCLSGLNVNMTNPEKHVYYIECTYWHDWSQMQIDTHEITIFIFFLILWARMFQQASSTAAHRKTTRWVFSFKRFQNIWLFPCLSVFTSTHFWAWLYKWLHFLDIFKIIIITSQHFVNRDITLNSKIFLF